MTASRVLLADPHAAVRPGGRQLLETDEGRAVIGKASDGFC